MLAIRMQRTGRKGHAMFRMIVQDARRTPTSGKVVAQLGSYDPHSKSLTLNKEKASFYLKHGAQPSDRVARLLKAEGVKLPAWVALSADKQRVVRNADKRRSTRPDEPEAPAAEETPVTEEAPVEAEAAEAPATEESTAAEEPAAEAAPEEAAPAEVPTAEESEAPTAESTETEAAAETKEADAE